MSCVLASQFAPAHARADLVEDGPPRTLSPWVAAGLWTAAQLIPSPLLVLGSAGPQGGVRWQITPFLYSFGVAARPVRAFVVEPIARHTGAVELYFSPEWACCAAQDKPSWLARAGARVYLPLVLSGESASISLGGSYAFSHRGETVAGIAGEIGLYTLSSMLGLTLTIAPRLTGRELIAAIALHYF